jgi:hypothetical protein
MGTNSSAALAMASSMGSGRISSLIMPDISCVWIIK